MWVSLAAPAQTAADRRAPSIQRWLSLSSNALFRRPAALPSLRLKNPACASPRITPSSASTAKVGCR
jgi:hypothetical protein